MSRRNLLDLRRSERLKIARGLTTPAAFLEIVSEIEQTLLDFPKVTAANEEQIYLFGVDMRQLLKARENQGLRFPGFRSDIDESVRTVFGGGFLGLTLAETMAALRERLERHRVRHSNPEPVDRRVREVSLVR
jgi:hypothetical protein